MWSLLYAALCGREQHDKISSKSWSEPRDDPVLVVFLSAGAK